MARRGSTAELAALLASLDLSAFLPAFVEDNLTVRRVARTARRQATRSGGGHRRGAGSRRQGARRPEGGRRRGAAGGSAEPGRAEVLAGRRRRPGAGVIRRRRRGAGARTRAQVFLGVLWLDTAGPLAGHR